MNEAGRLVDFVLQSTYNWLVGRPVVGRFEPEMSAAEVSGGDWTQKSQKNSDVKRHPRHPRHLDVTPKA